MVDDYDSKLVSANSKYQIDNEINRIDMYSPDLTKMTKNEFQD